MVHTVDDLKGVFYAVDPSQLHTDTYATGLLTAWNGTIVLDNRCSGVHLRFKWDMLNPSKDTYDWTAFDGIMNTVVAAGKRATVVVMAGKWTPDWAIRNGGMKVNATYDNSNSDYSQAIVPLPHEDRHVDNYLVMMKALAEHIQDNSDFDDAIVLVKCGLFVSHSAETRLIPVDGYAGGADNDQSDSLNMFERGLTEEERIQVLNDRFCVAGYKEAFCIAAMVRTVGYMVDKFENQYIGFAFVPGSKQFPTNGVGVFGGDPSDNNTLFDGMYACVVAYPNKVMVNNTTLDKSLRPATEDFYASVLAANGYVGNQINAQKLGYRSSSSPNDPEGLEDAFAEGRANGGIYIEVHDGNMTTHIAELTAENTLLNL